MVMNRDNVAVINTDKPLEGAKRALASMHASQYFQKDERILIKPNYVTNDLPRTGVTTDPRVVLGVVEYLRDSGFDDIIVAEGGSTDFDTMETFEKVGLVDVVRDVRLIDLNRGERVEVTILNATKLRKVNVAKTFLECDAIVSVAKLKVHRLAVVTLNMKNMMGGILPKSIMHEDIHEKIVDLNRRFMPRLGVIDGIIGCQTHETGCDPVRSNVIVAGSDIVATDVVGAFLMGIDSHDVKHLELAALAGMGTNDLNQIEITGDDHKKLQKRYRRADL